jgi:hypothetical protein
MSKKKPFVIYKQFWVSNKWTKWDSFATKDEAEAVLKRLQSSPSAEYNYYELRRVGG